MICDIHGNTIIFDAFIKIAKEIDNLGVSGEVSVDGNHIVQ